MKSLIGNDTDLTWISEFKGENLLAKILVETIPVILLCGASACLPQAVFAESPKIVGAYQFASHRILDVQNKSLPRSTTNDRGIFLGGFSDLYRTANDPPNEFWIVTDRGPNAQVSVDDENRNNQKRRTFPVPEYAPMILHVKATDKELQLIDAMPIVGRSGKPLSGKPNLAQFDGGGYNFTGRTQVSFTSNGIDPEGMVRTSDGAFWLAEEYRPSLLKLDSQGKVVKRFIPKGQSLVGADYGVVSVLPEIYAKRQDNRGFEGLAMSDDGAMLYAIMQSPLANPTEQRSKSSRIARLLVFDTRTEQPVAEYAYQFDKADQFNPGSKPADMKIGAIATSVSDQILVLERDDQIAKIYSVDLLAGTNLLELPCHHASEDITLETAADLSSLKVTPLSKTLVADLSRLKELSGKLEGLAVVDSRTVAIVNDNDFGFSGFDKEGQAIPNGKDSCLFMIQFR